jgi:putative spermidine/putrescine transport system permease protein
MSSARNEYRRRRRRAAAVRILMAAYLTAAIAFLAAPLVVVALASFTTTSYLTVPPRGFSLRWFEVVLTSPAYLSAIATSVLLALTATACSTVLGTATAYGLTRFKFRGRAALASLFNAPLIVPAGVFGVAMLQYLTLTSLRGGYWPLVALHAICTIPFVIRSVLASLTTADPLAEQAARTLGATAPQAFFLVLLPMITPGIVSGAIFAFIISIGEASATLFVLSARQSTLPVLIFSMVEHGVDPSIAAACTMMIGLTSVLLIVAARFTGFYRHL